MHLTVRLLGRTVLDVHVDTEPAPPGQPEPSEHTVAHRHSGDFGFAGAVARPYWTSDPTELPPIP